MVNLLKIPHLKLIINTKMMSGYPTYQALLSQQTDVKVVSGIYKLKAGNSMALMRTVLADDNEALLVELCRELRGERWRYQ